MINSNPGLKRPTRPTFETSAPRLAVLTTHVFVGSGVRHPRPVVFDFFRVL